jgi:hypothetical protein
MTRIEEEAEVTKPVSSRRSSNALIVASIALAFTLSGMAQSFAGCGGYCDARRVRAMCNHAVKTRGLQAPAREAEFEKCKADPLSYLGKPVRKGT